MTPRAGVLVAVLAALVAYALTDAYARGHRDGLVDVSAARVREVERIVYRTDTLYKTDTLRLARWRTLWDSVRVTDTLVRDSVVYVPRDAADSVVSACYAVVRSCEARVAARDSLISSLRVSLKQAQAKDSKLKLWADRALWFGAGLGVGAVVGVAR